MPQDLMTNMRNIGTKQGKIYLPAPLDNKWNNTNNILEYEVAQDKWSVKRTLDQVCYQGRQAMYNLIYYVRAM